VSVGGGRLSLAAKITLLAAATEAGALLVTIGIVGREHIDRPDIVALAAVFTVPVVIVYGLTRFLVARLTVPVISTYERLAAGDFAAELPPMTAGKDFLGLRDGFRAMADALERSLATIRSADRDRRRLFADLAHELATPTTTLLGIAAALRSGAGDRDRLLDHLEGESARLERLIADVRELAVLDDPALAMQFAPCDIGALATATVEKVRLASPTAGDMGCIAAATIVEVDAVRIEQILNNLLRNAVRHAAGKAIEVRVARVGAEAIIRVEDAGPGVPDDRLPDLGRRLLRVDPSRDRDTGGHGLGLSIVLAIAARHGGTVRFGRARIGGLAVEVRLPCNRALAAAST